MRYLGVSYKPFSVIGLVFVYKYAWSGYYRSSLLLISVWISS